jgi:hypothetical protein
MILVKEADEIKGHHEDLLVSFGISLVSFFGTKKEKKKIRKEIKKKKIKRIRIF